MSWKKFAVMIMITSTLLYCAIVSYINLYNSGILTSYSNYITQKKLKEAISSNAKKVKISELTTFEWDELCFYFPYQYNLQNNSFIEEGDGRYNIEFKKLNEIILVINLSKNLLDEEKIILNLNSRCFGIGAEILIEKKKLINIHNSGA